MKTRLAAFIQNRSRFTLDELRKYDGQWVAFSDDGTRIVASKELAGLARQLSAAGEDPRNVYLERIVLDHGLPRCR
jgi:hypothetical protein